MTLHNWLHKLAHIKPVTNPDLINWLGTMLTALIEYLRYTIVHTSLALPDCFFPSTTMHRDKWKKAVCQRETMFTPYCTSNHYLPVLACAQDNCT